MKDVFISTSSNLVKRFKCKTEETDSNVGFGNALK